MPNAVSWLNMAELVQRIIKQRVLQGYHTYDVEILKQWLTDAVIGWHRHPTPLIWGGKRHVSRDRTHSSIVWEVPVPLLLTLFLDIFVPFATTAEPLIG